MRNKYTCDLCGGEGVEREWDDAPMPVQLSVYCHSQNPMGFLDIPGCGFQDATVHLKEVCEPCRSFLARCIARAIKSRHRRADR